MELSPAAGGRGLGRLARLVLVSLLVATACARGGLTTGTGGSRAEPTAVRDLGSIGALQDRFDRDAGRIRLILLLSPT